DTLRQLERLRCRRLAAARPDSGLLEREGSRAYGAKAHRTKREHCCYVSFRSHRHASQAAASDSLPNSTYMPIRIQHDKAGSTRDSARLGKSARGCALIAMSLEYHNGGGPCGGLDGIPSTHGGRRTAIR